MQTLRREQPISRRNIDAADHVSGFLGFTEGEAFLPGPGHISFAHPGRVVGGAEGWAKDTVERSPVALDGVLELVIVGTWCAENAPALFMAETEENSDMRIICASMTLLAKQLDSARQKAPHAVNWHYSTREPLR